MSKITTIGLDLAMTVFQVHGIDEAGTVVVRRRLRRGQVLAFFVDLPRCLVGMEACAAAHHWARELIALGHDVRLMPPQYVKAYVRRQKNDAADAEAICEAVQRPSMRFVPVKTAEQQSVLMMHGVRDFLIRQRTMLVNALRGHLAEFGIIAAKGMHKIADLITIVMDTTDGRIPEVARQVLQVIACQIGEFRIRIATLGHDPGDRTHHRKRDRSDGSGPKRIPQRPRVYCLAWTCAPTALHGWQGQIGWYQQAW